MNWNLIAECIQSDLKTAFHIVSAAKVIGGDIHQAYKLHVKTDDIFKPEQNFFIKLNTPEAFEQFSAEALALKIIEKTHSCQVPKVIHLGTKKNQAWLLLSHFNLSNQGDDLQRGKDLALLHHHTQKRFGFDSDNFIGLTPQINTWNDNWIDFFAKQRLGFQLDLAQANGANDELVNQGHQLITHLPKFFETYQPEASLLHGDLWSGNSAFDEDGQAVFFDPACYYGDRETDLAMSELFGGFSPAFYNGYQQVFPLDKGYEQRKPLYQLYHLLNHFNMFGGFYQEQALETLASLLRKFS